METKTIIIIILFGDGNENNNNNNNIRRWKRKQRKRVFVLVDSFQIYQARSVLVGWVVGVGGCPAVPSFPAQTKGRFRKHESTSTEGKHAQKHAQKAHKSTTEGTESRKAREHESTRAREHESTRAKKHERAEGERDTLRSNHGRAAALPRIKHAPRKSREGRISRWGLAGVGPDGDRLAPWT